MTVQLLLLGMPALIHGDREQVLDCERRTQLLVYLAWKRSWVARGELAALLWPDLDRNLALANLRKALHRLHALEVENLLEADGGLLRCALPTDVQALLRAVANHDHAQVLKLWRGPLLEGFDDGGNQGWTDWLEFERTRLQSAWRASAQAYLGTLQDPAAGVALALRLHEEEPFDEDSLRQAMLWLARAGQRASAQNIYLAHAGRMRSELGLEPAVELVQFAQRLMAGEQMDSIPSADIVAAVAADDGPFVGRATEVRRIDSLLDQPDCRLLSITGDGGAGKTRLALEVARRFAHRFEHGVAVVQLEDISETSLVFDRIARDIGLAVRPGSSAQSQVVAALRDQQRLLVLDSFEQIVGAAVEVGSLLRLCPRLRILVTSRIRLSLPEEWLLPLDGLPVPEPEDRDNFAAFDAPRLFIRAAQRVQPDFDAAAERDAIIELCHQVGGLPLALELAAAWTRVLSCAEIVHELTQSTELLRTVDDSRPQRHASLEAVFNHSWQLLTQGEREGLARLSVFAGSFSINAARAVANAPLPVLRALADKSLLRREGSRLSLHPLMQQLARARLAHEGWQATAEAAHAAYFHHFLHRLRPDRDSASSESLDEIAAEFANIRLAWQHAILHGQGAQLLRSLPALESYFEDRARFAEGIELLAPAVRNPAIAANGIWSGSILAELAAQTYRLGRYDEASRIAQDALTRIGEGEEKGKGRADFACYRANWVLGASHLQTGRIQEGANFMAEARKFALAAGDLDAENTCIANLALAEKRMGNYPACLALTLEAVARHRMQGNPARIALGLCNLGSLYLFLDKFDLGRQALDEALQMADAHDLVSTRAYVLANLAEMAMKQQDDAAAEQFARQALVSADAFGLRVLSGWLKAQVARLARRRAALPEAGQMLREAATLSLEMSAATVKAAVVQAFAERLLLDGHREACLRTLYFAAHEAGLSAPDRDEISQRIAALGESATQPRPWSALTLDALLQRVVQESGADFSLLVTEIESA